MQLYPYLSRRFAFSRSMYENVVNYSIIYRTYLYHFCFCRKSTAYPSIRHHGPAWWLPAGYPVYIPPCMYVAPTQCRYKCTNVPETMWDGEFASAEGACMGIDSRSILVAIIRLSAGGRGGRGARDSVSVLHTAESNLLNTTRTMVRTPCKCTRKDRMVDLPPQYFLCRKPKY